MSASLLPAPEIRETYECILVCLFIHLIYRKSVPKAVAELTMSLLAHTSSAVLSTLVYMCSKGFISDAKICRWGTYSASSSSLMVKSHCGFSSMSNICAVFDPTGIQHTNYFMIRLWHTPPIHMRGVSVAPFQVGGFGLVSLKCSGLLAKEVIK